MVRTKADAYTKAAVKAPRKQSALKGESASTPKNGKSDRHSGGNPYCPRPTPAWQKPITNFFSKGDDKDNKEKKSMQDASATSSCVGFHEPVPSCSKDDPELMEFMDSENMSFEDESSRDDSVNNLEAASNDDSKLDKNSLNLDPVINAADAKLEVDAKNLDPVVNGGDSKLVVNANNLSPVADVGDSKLEEDAESLQSVPNDVKVEKDVMNSEPVPNGNANLLPCGSKEAINNGDGDSEAIPPEVDYQDDDSSNLSENSGINAATIGVHASPTVNDLDDQDSGCVDE